MDIFIIDRVIAEKYLRPCQKIVLVALAYSRPSRVALERVVTKGALNNQCFVGELLNVFGKKYEGSTKRLSELTGYTPRQVRNILGGLSAKGLVKKEGGNYVLAEESKLAYVHDEVFYYAR